MSPHDVVVPKRERAVPAPTSHITVPFLRAWRVSKLWTQAQLAEASGVSVPTVIRAEGGSPIGAITAKKLARALSISVRQLQAEEPQD
jgi:transcriptional regulator with XRE-family HTH domain